MESTEQKTTTLKLVRSETDERLLGARKQCQALCEGHARLINGHERDLQPGMLAQWKYGMKNRSGPGYGEPRIVVEVLSEPIICAKFDSGSVYFREPLSLILGFLDEDGDFLTTHVDARRFEPYDGPGMDPPQGGDEQHCGQRDECAT